MFTLPKKFDKKYSELLSLYEEKEIIGVSEPIVIQYVGNVNAKIDSGNDGYNVLSGTNIKEKNGTVFFTSVNGKKLNKKIIEYVDIHTGGGNSEHRPVIKLNFKFRGKMYKNVPFSISDRSENDCPVLIGKKFLKTVDVLIDPNKKATSGKDEDDQVSPTFSQQTQNYITNAPWDNSGGNNIQSLNS